MLEAVLYGVLGFCVGVLWTAFALERLVPWVLRWATEGENDDAGIDGLVSCTNHGAVWDPSNAYMCPICELEDQLRGRLQVPEDQLPD